MSADYEPLTRCAACDSDIPERTLLAHFDTCKAKAEGPSQYYAYSDKGFERIVGVKMEVGDTRDFRYTPTPDASGEVRLAIMPAGCDGQHIDGFACPECPTPESVQTDPLAATMQERNARYGDFRIQARVGKAIRFAMRLAPNWHKLTPSQELALDWISDKIARILCGDTRYSDNWHDLAGYAKLGERDCVGANVDVYA